jgi:hypothetical protein
MVVVLAANILMMIQRKLFLAGFIVECSASIILSGSASIILAGALTH